MDGQYCTASEIAEIMGTHKTSIIRRAKKEYWSYVNGNGNGGNHYKYYLPSLPPDIQTAIVVAKGAAGISPDIIPALAPEAALKLADEFLPIPAFADTVKISTAGR
ncbi:MAG: DNA-binding protein, partial [Smithella sp.]